MGLSELARRTVRDPTAIGLVAANLVACTLAAFHPPVMVSVLFLYCAECAVIGVINAVKLYFVPYAPLDEMPLWFRVMIRSSLSLHYFIFVAFLFFALVLAGAGEMKLRGVTRFDVPHYLTGFVLPVLCIAAAHAWSFFRNFLRQREYYWISLKELADAPYKRVGAMLAIMAFGGILVGATRLPEISLLVFVPFKMIADLRAHVAARKPLPGEKVELRLL